MNTLPTDIKFSCILPKLPAKSVLRFKCVSKSFLAEITSPNFIKLHHRNVLTSNENRLLIIPFNYWCMAIYNLDSPEAPPMICRYPKPVTSIGVGLTITILSSCECYLLIVYGKHNYNHVLLFNPTTRSSREIPNCDLHDNSGDVRYGMCHIVDDINDDYKIVRFTSDHKIMIYSLRANGWKSIEGNRIPPSCYSKDVILVQNHLLHFNFYSKGIGCFDVKAEQWGNDVPVPDFLFDENNANYTRLLNIQIGSILDGKLCLIGINEPTYDLWVMKDYGVQESWIKLASVPRFNNDYSLYDLIDFRKGSPDEILCFSNSYQDFGNFRQLYWYNLKNKDVGKDKFERLPYCEISSTHYVCKGSLVNFPSDQPISRLMN